MKTVKYTVGEPVVAELSFGGADEKIEATVDVVVAHQKLVEIEDQFGDSLERSGVADHFKSWIAAQGGWTKEQMERVSTGQMMEVVEFVTEQGNKAVNAAKKKREGIASSPPSTPESPETTESGTTD
jgi:hypothetical protein